MPLFYAASNPAELRDIPAETIAAWEASENPKLSQWIACPPQPSADASWADGQWVTPVPPEPQPNYQQLWGSLLVSEVFGSVREQALQSLPLTVAYTDFAAAMAVALAGVPNPQAIAASARSVLASATLTADHKAELRELFHAAALDDIADLALLPRRIRAHNQDGTFRADDPATPDVDEAWEELP